MNLITSVGRNFFNTAIGRCGVAWSERGLLAVQLPAASDERTFARVVQHAPDAREAPMPGDVQRACDAMTALLEGESPDLTFIALDTTNVPSFNQQVYEITRAIPHGETRTYGEIARQLGDVALSRAVGQALGQNPLTIVVPCHRVLAANGKTGGFSATGGVTTKFKMLAIEKARIARRDSDQQTMLFEPELSVAPLRRRG
jgi:methylated-DNA-[protein]-cysteine S-methyltransferase